MDVAETKTCRPLRPRCVWLFQTINHEPQSTAGQYCIIKSDAVVTDECTNTICGIRIRAYKGLSNPCREFQARFARHHTSQTGSDRIRQARQASTGGRNLLKQRSPRKLQQNTQTRLQPGNSTANS